MSKLVRQGPYTVNYVATGRTEQVKEGPGILHAIVVGVTAAGAIDVIDGISGTTANIASLKASIAEGVYTFDVAFSVGLRVITAAASNITILYQ